MSRVLVVEDDKLNQLVTVTNLRKLGYDVVVARNGAEAVSASEEATFDAILMDIQMPVMDGYQATRIIRARAVAGEVHVPIIGLSARAMDGDREAAIAHGLDDYLAKPLRPDELKDMLERWTNGSLDTVASPPLEDPELLTSVNGGFFVRRP